MPQKKPTIQIDAAIQEILRQLAMIQPQPSHVPGPPPVSGPFVNTPPPPPGGFGGPTATIGPDPLSPMEQLAAKLGFRTRRTHPQAFGYPQGTMPQPGTPPEPFPMPAPAAPTGGSRFPLGGRDARIGPMPGAPSAPVAGPPVSGGRDINLPLSGPATGQRQPSSGPLAALARAVPPTPAPPDAQGGSFGPGATGLNLPMTDMSGQAPGGFGLGATSPFGGMSPDLEAAIAAVPEPAPDAGEQTAEQHNGFWGQFLEAMPMFAVNFASAMLDRPDIAQNYLADRQMQIKAVLDRQRLEAEMQENNFQRQMQLANLEINKVGIRMKANDVATDLQKRVVDGQMSAGEYARAVVAAALDFRAAGGDPQEFLKSHPTPQWALINKMRDEAIKAYFNNAQGNPDVLSMAVIPNYLGDPSDPSQRQTIMKVLLDTGWANENGVVDLPGLVDMQKIESNDAAGNTKQEFVTKGELRKRGPIVSPPKPGVTVLPNANGDIFGVTTQGGSFGPARRIGAGPQTGIGATLDMINNLDVKQLEKNIARNQIMGGDPNAPIPGDAEIANWLADPKNRDYITKTKAAFNAGLAAAAKAAAAGKK